MATVTISEGSHDGYWLNGANGHTLFDSSFTTSIGEARVFLGGGLTSVAQGSFFQFDGVIPGDAVAFLLKLTSINSTQPPLTANVALYDADSGQAPMDAASAINPTLTSNKISVSNLDPNENLEFIIDITAPFMEVINRSGWQDGNSVCVDVRSIFDDPADIVDTTGKRTIVGSVERSGSVPAQLILVPPNTAPEITVTPSVSYGSLTRLGPNNTPATVTFTATDTEDTSADELTYEIRTAASGGGTLVATGNCTSGASKNASIAYNASGISEGSNTLYLRVGDGSLWSDDESFTVLMDATAPTVGAITHSPNPVTET